VDLSGVYHGSDWSLSGQGGYSKSNNTDNTQAFIEPYYNGGYTWNIHRGITFDDSAAAANPANWHDGDGAAQIDTVAKQKAQMKEMVALLESRADVYRYAWFTGRWDNDDHFSSLLGANGQLTELGQYYLSLPF
jgi:hypothetical protein